MIDHPKLYKRTSTGATQIWFIQQNESEYRVHTGQIGGKITISEWKQAFGKNQGKANETTDITQADAEIAAEYKKKKAQGKYHDTVEDIDNSTYFAPMLAHKYEKYIPTQQMYDARIVLSSPKLDGVRCIADKNGLWTRRGKPIVAMPHIWEALKPIFQNNPEIILDGELYNHDLRDHLNRISGLCRKKKLTKDEFEQTKQIQYHVYDCDLGHGETFIDRFHVLATNVLLLGHGSYVKIVDARCVYNKDQLDELNSKYLSQGYEGQIIRIDGQPYQNKRTKYLLKRKEFQDQEFTITGFTEGVGNRAGMAGNITYVTDDGVEFSSGIAGGEEFYKMLWKNKEKYIGGQGTVRFFLWTEYGKPFLPVTYDVYENKRDL